MQERQGLALFERRLQAFLSARLHDVDAQSAVYNLDHSAMDVIATMESLALRPHGLTHAGFVMLMTLWVTGPRETRQLASVLRVTKGAVVGSVNTLERKGLIRRQRLEIDRRLVSVELTAAGRRLVKRAQKRWHELELQVTAPLTRHEKQLIATLCRKMAVAAREIGLSQRGPNAPTLPDPREFLETQ